jgi:hypothetical protein
MNDDSLTEKLMMVFLHYLGCKAPLYENRRRNQQEFTVHASARHIIRGIRYRPALRRRWQGGFAGAPFWKHARMLEGFLGKRCTGACSISTCLIISLTTGSSSNNCICPCESFSPPAPFFSIRISRSRSSSTRIRSSVYWSLLFSCAMSSRSASAEEMGATLKIA